MRTVLIAIALSMLLSVGCNKDDDSNNVVNSGPEHYIGNTQSHVFHRSNCSYLPNAENRITLNSCDEATSQNYTPCGHCNPCQ